LIIASAGVAIVLIAGVLITGVIPSGDRAGTVTSSATPEASVSATPVESVEATPDVSESATPEASVEATPDVSESATPEASVEATPDVSESATPEVVIVSCADGGECAVGDFGPGGSIVFYVASSPFTCAPDRASKCTYLEATTAIGTGPLCDVNKYSRLRPFEGIGLGSQNTYLAGACPGGTLAQTMSMTDGGQSDWFVPSVAEMQLAYDNAGVIGLSVVKNFSYWASTLGNAGSTAARLRTDINYWNYNYGTASSGNYVVPMRNF